MAVLKSAELLLTAEEIIQREHLPPPHFTLALDSGFLKFLRRG